MKGGGGGKITINTGNDKHNLQSMNKGKYRKRDLKVDRSKLFTDPIIELSDDEQHEKFEEFIEFCEGISKCLQCGKNVDLSRFHSTEDAGGIRGQCPACLNYVSDESPQARAHVKWLNNTILNEYGMNFADDGMPKLIQYEKKGEWCKDCQGYHVTMHSWDLRDEGRGITIKRK